ncbi:MAG TPA: SRPBCC domain-containing protein [Candidatus Saccharimonadales bacterium]|nr:SRPBCC domain-containing protein [Candidatus Saccharimonadales bacterium]
MSKGFIAQANITVNAQISKVWNALVNPDLIKQYMFGTTVISDWKEGSSIIWKGEWQGKPYEDKGNIVRIEPEKVLEVTHYSPLSGVADIPENYHRVKYELERKEDTTKIILTQDNNANEEEKERSEKNWQMFLEGLKKLLEK